MAVNPELEQILAHVTPAPALPAPTGKVVRADTPEGIINAIEDADEGSTILIAKGHYLMPRDCILTSHRVTVRGETGNREDVILDGDMEFDDTTPKFKTRIGAPALIKISHAREVTIADLTVANNPKYGILFFGDGRVRDLKIYNVKFHNCWARGLKGTGRNLDDKPNEAWDPKPEHFAHVRPCNGEVRHCLFVADHKKRNDQDGFEGDYIAGMDMMKLYNWTIADNVFVGIRGMNGGARGSIFIWIGSERITVENNLFVNCDKGISLGNPSAKARGAFHIHDSVIRNNTILGGTNKAIEVEYGNNVEIVGNRIFSNDRCDYASIQVIDIEAESSIHDNIIHAGNAEPYNVSEKVTIKNDEVGNFAERFVDAKTGAFYFTNAAPIT